jgi:D-alanyl-D-alanine carboxypeptidase
MFKQSSIYPLKWLILLSGILLLLSCTKKTTPHNDPLLQDLPEAALQAVLNNYLSENNGILAVVFQLTMEGYHPWSGASGYFDLSRTQPAERDNRFLIGSITKTFTATMVLQLFEDGLLQLDSPLRDYLPPDITTLLDSIPYASTVTIRQALTHRSGLWNYVRSIGWIESLYRAPATQESYQDLLHLISREGQADFQPGTAFRYSNTNFMLLGAVLEHLCSQAYATLLNERIIQSLNLSNTYLPPGVPLGQDDALIHGYENDFYGWLGGRTIDGLEFNCNSAGMRTAGGLVSNSTDLITFISALLAGNLFQQSSTLTLMTNVPENSWYGMGIETREHEQRGEYYGHCGGMTGFNSCVFYFPEQQLALSGCLMLDGTVEYISIEPLAELLIQTVPQPIE